MKFRPASAFTLFCVEVQTLHFWSLNYRLLPLYKCLLISQLNKYIAEV